MEFKFKFDNLDELNEWFNWCCTRCAMCNRDSGKADPCSTCKANKVYETRRKEIEEGGDK